MSEVYFNHNKITASCGGDKNAKAGCGVNCGRLCSNYDQKPTFCPLICKVNSCDCKPNFVLDTNTGKCVDPVDCREYCSIYLFSHFSLLTTII